MKVPFELNGRNYLVQAYNTFQEKEILLLSSFGVDDFDRVFEVLNFECPDISDDEKKVLLYKFREVSIGDEIDVKYKCDSCGHGNDAVLGATDFVIPSKRNDSDIKKIFKPFSEDNMHEYVDIDVDELDLDEYEELKQRIIDNQTSISFIKQARCGICNHPKKFNLGDTKYIIEIMSEDTLMTLYKTYNFLVYFGKYTKEDVDKMYPFERNIFVGLLNKTKEDLNK